MVKSPAFYSTIYKYMLHAYYGTKLAVRTAKFWIEIDQM